MSKEGEPLLNREQLFAASNATPRQARKLIKELSEEAKNNGSTFAGDYRKALENKANEGYKKTNSGSTCVLM
jgi:hypothetical protein